MEIKPFNDTYFMKQALAQAKKAYDKDEVPVGAIIVCDNQIIARAHNYTEALNDVTAHAEMQAFTAAADYLGGKYLNECTLYVTLEPCAMCAQAVSLARVRRLYFGAYDPKSGGVEHGARVFDHSTCHHRPEVVGGIAESDCASLLKVFFKDRR